MTVVRAANSASISYKPSSFASFQQLKLFHSNMDASIANPVAVQMISYALSHARSQKSGKKKKGILSFGNSVDHMPNRHFVTKIHFSIKFFMFLNYLLQVLLKLTIFGCWVRFLIDESYAQGLLVLEQCLSTQLSGGDDAPNENSKGMVLLAMSTLLSERFPFCIHLIFFSDILTPFFFSLVSCV